MGTLIYIFEKPEHCYDCIFCDDSTMGGDRCRVDGHKIFDMSQCPVPEVDDNTAEMVMETMMDGGFEATMF